MISPSVKAMKPPCGCSSVPGFDFKGVKLPLASMIPTAPAVGGFFATVYSHAVSVSRQLEINLPLIGLSYRPRMLPSARDVTVDDSWSTIESDLARVDRRDLAQKLEVLPARPPASLADLATAEHVEDCAAEKRDRPVVPGAEPLQVRSSPREPDDEPDEARHGPSLRHRAR